jgi:predicted nuclease of predicted toxin-antitoxin system
MKFFLDHDVPDDLSHLLDQLGHEVVFLRDILPATTPDEQVLAEAISRDVILLTCNRDDFVALAAGRAHPGIIVIIRRRSRLAEKAALLRLMERAGENGLAGNINFA